MQSFQFVAKSLVVGVLSIHVLYVLYVLLSSVPGGKGSGAGGSYSDGNSDREV